MNGNWFSMLLTEAIDRVDLWRFQRDTRTPLAVVTWQGGICEVKSQIEGMHFYERLSHYFINVLNIDCNESKNLLETTILPIFRNSFKVGHDSLLASFDSICCELSNSV